MLNFTIKPGECFTIGEDIKVVVLGGTANNIKIMVDAPRSYNIVRGKVLEKNAKKNSQETSKVSHYYPEPPISQEAIRKIIAKQRKEKKQAEQKKLKQQDNNAALT